MNSAKANSIIAGQLPKEPLCCLTGETNGSRLCGGPLWEKAADGRRIQCAELTRIVENVTCSHCQVAIDRFLGYGYKPRVAWGTTRVDWGSNSVKFSAYVFWKKKDAPKSAVECHFMRASSVRQWLKIRGLTLAQFRLGTEPQPVKLHPALEAKKKKAKSLTETAQQQ